MQVAVIIATMNREKELKRCIDSIKTQTILPKEIIIVDDGNLNQENIKEMIRDEIRYKYYKKDEPSVFDVDINNVGVGQAIMASIISGGIKVGWK